MASAVYPLWKAAVLQASANSSLAGTVKAVIVDTADYTYSAAHDFLDDVPSGARIGTSGALASKTYTSGVFDAADATVTAATGDVSEAVIVFIDTGSEATSRLVSYHDGLTITPNGGDITITWNASGIFAI